MLIKTVNSGAGCGADSTANNQEMADDRSERTIPRNVVAAEATALKALFEAKAAMSQERFGLEYEIGKQAMVWQYLNAVRPLNLSAALKFARGLSVPVSKFSPRLGSELESLGIVGAGSLSELHLAEPVGIASKRIPVLGTVRGGDDRYYVEIEYPPGQGDGFVSYPAKRSSAYALRVKGDSMRPRIKPGEYVIVEPDVPCLPGDEVVVRTKAGRSMVKVLHAKRSGFVELLSLNDDHAPITIDVSDIELMHHVTGIAKEPLYDGTE